MEFFKSEEKNLSLCEAALPHWGAFVVLKYEKFFEDVFLKNQVNFSKVC